MTSNSGLLIRLLLAGLLLVVEKGLAEEDYVNDDEPLLDNVQAEILSKPLNLSVKPGSTVFLPCETDTPDEVFQWKKGSTDLYFGDFKQTSEKRYVLLSNKTLMIENVMKIDQDVYKCLLLANSKSLDHHIFVESGAEIVKLVPNVQNGSEFTPMKGKPLTLACEAHGYPAPKVTWTHISQDGKTREFGNIVAIDQLSIENSGKYICTASNSNGPPSIHGFTLQLQSAPEIKTPKEVVNSAERYESELVCTVEAYPKAKVYWVRDGQEIVGPSHHYETLKNNNDHILRISGTKSNDFGEYECKAENKWGSASKSITLSGNPSKPMVKQVDITPDMNTAIEWEFESRAPITKFEINYKRQESSNWTSVVPVEPTNSSGILFIVRHIFLELSPGTYQARLKVKNSYGWSSFSDVYSFPGVNQPIKGAKPQESHLLENLEEPENSPDSILVESQPKYSSASQVRISIAIAFIASLLCSRLLH